MGFQRSLHLSNDLRRAFLVTSLVGMTAFVAFTGLLLAVSSPSFAQATYLIQRDPTVCEAVGNNWTECNDAFSSNNVYAYANGTAGEGGPIAFIDRTEQNTSGGSLTVTVPNHQDGDTLLAVLVHSDDDPVVSITPPVGWNPVRDKTDMGTRALSPPVLYVYERQASSEPASYVWSWDMAGGLLGVMLSYRGTHGSSPIGVNVLNAQTDTGANAVAPSVTTMSDNELALWIGWSDDDDNNDPDATLSRGTVRAREMIADGGNGAFVGVGDENIPSPGATGTATWTLTAMEQRSGVTITLLAVPAPGGSANDTAWKDFGFDLGSDTINTVEVGVEWFRSNAAPSLNVTISWDGGLTWAPNQTAAGKSADDDTVEFLDFTPAGSWTRSMMSDANLRARAGTNASGARLDHIVVRVTLAIVPPPEVPDAAPMVLTLDARNGTQDTAIVRGNLLDLGSATGVQVSFEWGVSPAFGQETAPETLLAPSVFQASLEGLNPGTTHYYRAKAVGNGTVLGETLTFQTSPPVLRQDFLSQLWPYLPIAVVAVLVAYFITKKLVGAPRRRKLAGTLFPGTGEAAESPGGLFAKVSAFPSLGVGRAKVQAGGQEAPLAGSTTMNCSHCGTLLEAEAVYCFGCGQGLSDVGYQRIQVERAEGAPEKKARDQDDTFTVGAHPAAAGEDGEAVEALNRLEEAASSAFTVVDQEEGPDGPGSCLYCGTTVEPETGNCPECGRSELDSGEALEEEVTRALATLQMDENDPEALFTLGTCLLLDGRAQEALDTLNRLTLLDPDYPGLWRAKALVFDKLGNKNAAESALVQAQRRSADLGVDAE